MQVLCSVPAWMGFSMVQSLELEAAGGPETFSWSSPDGAYSFHGRWLEAGIYHVEEVGYADEDSGLHTLGLLGRMLDRVQAPGGPGRLYLRVDYRSYKGTANPIRKRLLKEVLSHPALGGVVFAGDDFMARVQAVLLNLVVPGLGVRCVADDGEALEVLRQRATLHAPRATPSPDPLPIAQETGPRVPDLVGFQWRYAGDSRPLVIGGQEHRLLAPREWAMEAGPEVGSWCGLVDDEVLLVTLEGTFDQASMGAHLAVERRSLDDLGHPRLLRVYDLRAVSGMSREARDLFTLALAPCRGRTPGVVCVGRAWHRGWSLPGSRRWYQVVEDLDHAWIWVDQARDQASARLRGLPRSRRDLEALVRRQAEDLERLGRSRDHLFNLVSRISWHAGQPPATVVDTRALAPDEPLLSIYGALHFMYTDLVALLEEKQRRVEELKVAREQAEASDLARRNLLGVVSHELRTPLNAIVGLSGLLEESDLAPEPRQQVEAIRSAAAHLTRLVDDLLDFTRLEAGRLVLAPVPFDMAPLLVEVREALGAKASRKGIDLRIEADGLPEAGVQGDRARLLQVLLNLVDNGIKYTPQGRVTLSVQAGEGDRWTFAVTDTGRGILPEDTERIFKVFERGQDAWGEAGLGLGLPIARELVQRMGGSLELESGSGGSTFRFSLVLPRVEVLSPRSPHRAPWDDTPALAGCRVLLVEDDDLSRYTARRILERAGCSVGVASDGLEAVERFRVGAFDLVLMDCQLPRVDGFEATRRIRALEGGSSHTPVVALTAWALDETRDRVAAAGMDGYLAKPVSPERLVEWVSGNRGQGSPVAQAAPALDPEVMASLEESGALEPVLASFGPQARQTLEELGREQDPARVAFLAHRLAGRCGAVGARRLSLALRDVEARGGVLDPTTLERLESALEQVLERLSRCKVPAPPGPRGHVLVVDDDPVVLTVAQRMLEASGFEVTACGEAARALEQLPRARPPVTAVLLDLRMPDMDGVSLLLAMRDLKEGLHAVFWSGVEPELEVESRIRALGAQVLLKPAPMRDLARALDCAGSPPQQV